MSLITLSNQNMPLVEYQGQRVVTFAMIDEAHQRPKGTASAAFRRHRDRFTIGKHYFELDTDAIRGELKVTGYVKRTELSDSATDGIKRTQLGEKITNDVKRRQLLTELFPKHTKSGVVITELGYLLLTKPFTDDLAWQVQEQLVEAYFRPVAAFPDIRPIPVPTLEELEAMPPQQAADLIAQIEHRSHWRHGKHGSAEMTQRRRELKLIRPAIAHVQGLIQMVIPGLEVKS